MSEPKAMAVEFLDALGRHDTTTMSRLLDPDIAWWGAKQAAPVRPVLGRDQVLAQLDGGRGLFRADTTSWTMFRLVEEDGTVMAHVQRHSVTTAGKDYDSEYLWRFDIADGGITGVWVYTDTIYAQASVTPESA
jgi:ketosteroid isomerase-like protein